MGFLTEIERENLRIESMILHVVGEEEFEPQPARAVEHANFFIGRILDTDAAAVYEFKAVSGSRDHLQAMATGAMTFEAGAQELAREFSRLHGTTTRDGAFLIFELRTDVADVRLYSLIKYDYREAIEQMDGEDGQQRLRRIIHAFIDDKKAIQKAAIIRVVNGQAEPMISARDRTRPAPEIADYFATFLDVERTRSDADLNRLLTEALRKTLIESKDLLPNGDVSKAFRAAKGILRDRQEIDEDAVVDAVVAAAGHPADEQTVATLRRRTIQKLKTQRLTGIAFPPDRQILRKPNLRKISTVEGVVLMYPDEVNGVTVRRVANLEGPGEVITITTNRVVEDVVVPDRAR